MTSRDLTAIEMGLTSMTSILNEIYVSSEAGNDFLKSIDLKFTEFIDKFLFKPVQKITDSASSYLRLVLMENQNQTKILLGIAEMLHSFTKPKLARPEQTVNQSIHGSTFVDTQNVFNFPEAPSDKYLKNVDKLFKNMKDFLNIDKKQYEEAQDFWTFFPSALEKVKKHIWSVGLGIFMLAGGMLLFNVVSLSGIMKFIMILPIIGLMVGLMISRIVKAVQPLGLIKTFFVLRAIPDIIGSIGSAALQLGIGLFFFEMVGWGAIIKLVTAISLMGLVFSRFINKDNSFFGTLFLLGLAVTIYFLADRLKYMETVKWASIAKLNVFIATLGISLFIFKKTSGDNGRINPLTFLSIGLFMLTVSLLNLNHVSWEDIGKLNAFIIGMGLSLRISGMSNMKISPLTMFALGIALLTVSLIDFQELNILAIIEIIGVLGLLGVTINYFMGKAGVGKKIGNFADVGQSDYGGSMKLIGFAFGMAFMVLALYAFTEVPIAGLLKGIGFIAALGLTLKVFFPQTRRHLGGLPGFAFGLGLMVLAILAFAELPINMLLKMLVFIGALGLVLRLFPRNSKGTGMFGLAFGLGLMVLAILAFDELPFMAIIQVLGFLTALGLILKLFVSFKAVAILFLLSGAILVFAWAYGKLIEKINKYPVSWEDIGKLFVVIVGLAVLMGIIGIPVVAGFVALGAAVMILMGIAVGIFAWGLSKVNKLKIKWEELGYFAIGIVGLSLAFAGVALIAIPAAIGAVAVLVIALATILTAEAFKLISENDVNQDNITKFTDSIAYLCEGLTTNIHWILGALIPAVALIIISVSVLIASYAISKMSDVNIKEVTVQKFMKAVGWVLEGFKEFSGWNLVKTAAKAALIMPIMVVAWLASKVIEKINKTEIDLDKIKTFGTVIQYIVDTVVDTALANVEKLKSAEPGLGALAKLVSSVSGLANVVEQMANMRFHEYGVKDGKLVIVGSREFNSKDLEKVGYNIGVLVNALLKPLMELGSTSSSFTFGNMVIANPFKDNKALKGLDMIKRMGEVYQPIIDSIDKIANNEKFNNPLALNQFILSITSIFNCYKYILTQFEDMKIKNAKKVIEQIIDFNSSFEDLSAKTLNEFNSGLGKMINNLSDETKWRKISKNLLQLKKDFSEINKSMNGLDLKKAKAFEENLKILVNDKNTKNLAEVLEALKEMMGLVNEGYDKQANFYEKQTQAITAGGGSLFGNQFQQGQQAPGFGNQTVGQQPTNKVAAQQNKGKLSEYEIDLVEKLNLLFGQITAQLSGINSKLNGTINVKNVNPANAI